MRRPFALTHVSIVGVERENVFHDNTVDVSGTRIAAAGARVRILTGTRAITARSKVLIPGLRDLHSHSLDQWEWSSRLSMANGMTGVRGAGAIWATRDIVELRRAGEGTDIRAPFCRKRHVYLRVTQVARDVRRDRQPAGNASRGPATYTHRTRPA